MWKRDEIAPLLSTRLIVATMAKQNWPAVDRADIGTRPVPLLDSDAVVDYEEIPDRILNNLSAGGDRTFVRGHRLPILDSPRLATKTARLQNI